MSYSLYVLWYTVHSVVYTCDLILARVWLLDLCSFINRVLHSGSINRKILMLLLKPKYNIINAMLQKENLDTMEVGELVGEIRAQEMGILGMSE